LCASALAIALQPQLEHKLEAITVPAMPASVLAVYGPPKFRSPSSSRTQI
jgi:hypothetical protein